MIGVFRKKSFNNRAESVDDYTVGDMPMQTVHIQLDKPGSETLSTASAQSQRPKETGGVSFEEQLEKALKDTSGTNTDGERISSAAESSAESEPAAADADSKSENSAVRAVNLDGKKPVGSEIRADLKAAMAADGAADTDKTGVALSELAVPAPAVDAEAAAEDSVLSAAISAQADADILTEAAADSVDAEHPMDKKTHKRDTSAQSGDPLLQAAGSGALQPETAASALPFSADGAEAEGGRKNIKLSTGTALDEKIHVTDARSAADGGVTEAGLRESNFVTSVSYGDGSADITMNLAGDSGAQAGTASAASKPGESRFASLLSSELQSNVAEFVKTGSIVLRDGNAGTINLILHPEELGNVKISLNLHDKLISGHITVASEDAYNAFKNNIDSIKQAFNASGFETAGFDLSWSGGDTGSGSQHDAQQQTAAAEMLFKHTSYADMVDDGDYAEAEFFTQKIYSDSAQIAVNIMA